MVFLMENQTALNVDQKYVLNIALNLFLIKKLMTLYQLDMIQVIVLIGKKAPILEFIEI